MNYVVAILVVAVLITSGPTISQVQATEKTQDSCSLTMGWEPWEPYQFINKDNTLTGFDIELISEVFNDMDCAITFKEVNWARGIVEIRSGKLDLLPHADYTEERSRWAHFSDNYRDASQVLYVKRGASAKYQFSRLEDIIQNDFRLGVGRGVFIGDEFSKLMEDPRFNKHVFYIPTDEMQQYQMLQTGRVDGYIRSVTAIDSLRARLEDNLNLEIHPLPILTSKQHVMFSKISVPGNIVKKFNASLKNVIAQGIYSAIESRFIK